MVGSDSIVCFSNKRALVQLTVKHYVGPDGFDLIALHRKKADTLSTGQTC